MHFRTECSCGSVIEECRCPSKEKAITVVQNGCKECQSKELKSKIKDSRQV